MDPAKKGRSRTKSSTSLDATAQNDDSIGDAAADINGEDAKVIEKQDEPHSKDENSKSKSVEKDDAVADEKSDNNTEKSTRSRKRKASEMKSGDDSVEEPPKLVVQEETELDKTKGSVVNSSNKENVNDDSGQKKESSNKDETNKEEEDEKKVSDAVMETADKVSAEPSQSGDQSNAEPSSKPTLGKGKRARIPNKRYSDIALTSTGKSNKSLLENGDKRDSERIESEDDSTVPAAVSAIKSRSSTGSPFAKKPKLSVDLSNPNYLKPFKLGWKRELVYRATSDSATKRNGDIYYYTPAGKKVRSMREVSEHLDMKSELKLEDFTFFKEPLGLDDPEKEIIRDAKIKVGGVVTPSIVKKAPTTPKPQPVKTPKAKSSMTPKTPVSKPEPKAASTPTATVKPTPKTPAASAKTPSKLAAASSPKRIMSPKVVSSPPHVSSENSVEVPAAPKTKTPSKLGNFKIKPPAAKKTEKKIMKSEENMDTEPGPSKWSAKKTGKWTNSDSSDNKPCQPCSIRCPAMMGMVPTLQCRLCLCLYHHECVGMPLDCETQNYVCKNCYLDQEQTGSTTPAETPASSPAQVQPPPPPLTPINSLKSQAQVKSIVAPLVNLPKLQRIPRPGDVPLQPVCSPRPVQSPHELPRLVARPPPQAKIVKLSDTFPQTVETKSLVGSVTTWLPQNSKIQVDSPMMNPSSMTMAESPRPQFVEYLAGRKFLIIPKHNIVSVSPTMAVTPSSRPEDIVNIPESNKTPDDSASLGMKDVCDIKPEPESPSKPENAQTEAMDVDPTEQVPVQDVVGKSQDVDIDETEKESPTKAPPKKKIALTRSSSIVSSVEKKLDDSKFMDNYLQHLAYGYNTLLYVFQYLKVQDLLKAGCVCTMWRDVASHPLLWRTVRLKNSTVRCFKGLANTLEKHGTVHLDLRKMILPNAQADLMWPDFNDHISKVTTLRKIELCRCPAKVVEDLAISNPQLEIVNAVTIKCESISLDNMANFTDLKELRLKCVSGFSQTSSLDALRQLKSLRHLSLTSVRDLHKLNVSVIAELKNLDSLDLGECMDFPKNFGTDILLKLPKLEKLRLEKGQGNCHTFEILDAVKDLKKLEQLELVNFDIKPGFDKALGNCTNIKRLLIIPTYISQSATTNHMVLGGVLRLQKTLSHFVWGVTLELLRVTELFVDQCEEPDKKEKKEKEKEKKPTVNGDSIPVLKPVPLISEREPEIQPAYDPPQVEILPLPNLQKLLLQSLPTTRVKILKIPFHATWRQSITDSVN